MQLPFFLRQLKLSELGSMGVARNFLGIIYLSENAKIEMYDFFQA